MEGPPIVLEDGLDLQKLITSSSILNINVDYDDLDNFLEDDDTNKFDQIGEPVESFESLERHLVPIDGNGYVKKKTLEDGGGMPLHEGCTVYIAYSGYWEKSLEPFDIWKPNKPLVVDLKENGLLPGILLAVKSMLVGEKSIFLLSHQVAYGDLGIPPRIKPRAKCVFYIKLVKSILTPKQGPLNFSEPNTFKRVLHEVKMIHVSGVTLYKSKNLPAAIQLFKKGVNMLHKCHLADEDEEIQQQKLLVKLYTNLAICYNLTKQPLKACISCNELHRINNLWNNSKVLFQNAKALRMIGQFEEAHKKLKRALKLSPNNNGIKAEIELLENTSKACSIDVCLINGRNLIDNNFKSEVDSLVSNFKQNPNVSKLTLPPGMNSSEMEYVKEACLRENLFFNQVQETYTLDKESHDVKNFINFVNLSIDNL
ncbi:unnamed protein product [Pieris brassicae]|uniref:peptidylprolyl isomerase n=1 Tax=Pieris brassicae TaxID=7116 RepID=A0A9P0SLN5_PIEBR|nr:unnamed protein product [Pieris brassicae]